MEEALSFMNEVLIRIADYVEKYPEEITCDGLHLIVDTARHNGFRVDVEDVFNHIGECATCARDADPDMP